MKILFKANGTHYKHAEIMQCVKKFGDSYNYTVRFIINNSNEGISKPIFEENVGRLLSNFKMTRRGPFEGVKFTNGRLADPNRKVSACWRAVRKDLIEIRNEMDELKIGNRTRLVTNINQNDLLKIINRIWKAFKKLLPVCMGKHSLGMVASSKILFAVLPEIALPIDNKQWLTVFQTVDYGDIINLMVDEIKAWEKITGKQLQTCDHSEYTTLPAIYNVMAMKARPVTRKKSFAEG
jgi:hypothetical protein